MNKSLRDGRSERMSFCQTTARDRTGKQTSAFRALPEKGTIPRVIETAGKSWRSRVGGGRGFVVENDRDRDRLIVTAAHCLPTLPPCHPFSYLSERTYQSLLGPLGIEPTVWAECLFADPIADIAVLGSPDNQALCEQAEAYETLVMGVTPLLVGAAPKQGVELIKLGAGRFGGTIRAPTPGVGPALLLSLAGGWLDCSVTRRGPALGIDQEELVESGMSGSPILSIDGRAIALVSNEMLCPVLLDSLPPRLKIIQRKVAP